MRILITGAQGFIGKNLLFYLKEQPQMEVLLFVRGDSLDVLSSLVAKADAIIHLAGVNRPRDSRDFATVNVELTRTLCNAILATKRRIPLLFASSAQSILNNEYGKSKKTAEQLIKKFAAESNNQVVIYRLPGVFGKWSKPNYNSVVATFCYNLTHDLPIQIIDPNKTIKLVYIDDVIFEFLNTLRNVNDGVTIGRVTPEYRITLGELAKKLKEFKDARTSLMLDRVGTGLVRALYATYVSFLPADKFVYNISSHLDDRGVFAELFKTPDCGQISCFTAYPGVTRGGHYHHTKLEKFIIIKGSARFDLKNISTGEKREILVVGDKLQVVEIAPGWIHAVTNVGRTELVIILWANEVFDPTQQDTIRDLSFT